MQSQFEIPRPGEGGFRGWLGTKLPRVFKPKDRRETAENLGRKRIGIVVWALIFGAIAGLIELPMPAEDAWRAVRAEVRSKEVPADIVVVAVDDATLAYIGANAPSRSQDAQLVDAVFAAGANRLLFDKAYADPTNPADDAAFGEALERHKGKVWLGASPKLEMRTAQSEQLVPIASLREKAAIVSMVGQAAPFGLSVWFPITTVIDGRKHPSISATLVGYEGKEGWYRPDFAYDPFTIPTISYVDILDHRVEPSQLAGKSVIVGLTHIQTPDFHHLPLGDRIPGVYFHVLGAHTLKGGLPIDLLWFPALALVAAVVGIQAYRKTPSTPLTSGALIVLVFAPLAFDEFKIGVDIFPALIALGIATFRLHRLSARVYDQDTSLVLARALSEPDSRPDHDVYALKIENLGDFTEFQDARQFGKFVEQIIACMEGASEGASPATGSDGQVAFQRDMLIWVAPKLERRELDQSGMGLISVLRSVILKQGATVNLATTLGVDINHDLALSQRIQNAMRAADNASKANTRFVVCDDAFLDQRRRRMNLMSELEDAIRNDAIWVAHQPKIDLTTGEVNGAEALVRWDHPVLGAVSPQEFVTMAEEHDRIDMLTAYVLDRAVREAKPLLDIDPAFKLAVNVSAKSLAGDAIVEQVIETVGQYRFPTKNLILEVTETAELDDSRVATNLKDLLDLGVALSIDDFGMGHSSLDYLRRVPCSEVKMDRQFVSVMLTSRENRALVTGTIAMAHSLGKTVVAEGVEDAETADLLKQLGCDLAQGYFFSRAVEIAEVSKLIRERRKAA
ncbi:MAG: EAL domain-containing protein [Erythrobacter sp.]